MSEQLDFDNYPVSSAIDGHVGPPDGKSIKTAFLEFHAANPIVYYELVRYARQAKKAGATKVGIKMLFEVLRWNVLLNTARTGNDDFKLNNNYHSYYARLIMSNEPDLEGIFETRRLHQ